jgi:imidazolonepropionase
MFAGSRADEYEARATGVSYEEIARRGGGIVRTVTSVREASADDLVALAVPRAWTFLASGVTTVEVKSGYGLSLEHELRMLRAIAVLGDQTPLTVVPTFLGAHSYPRDVADRPMHVDAIVDEWIPAVAESGLARFCDVFCEKVAFSVADAERILWAGRAHGLKPKVHAEQLSAFGAAALAARVGAVSAEHLDFATDADIAAMAAAGVVAVLLPGCPVSLCNHRWVSARRFLDAGMKVALSTDFNPGSAVTMNLPLMGTFGMSFMGMSATEVWRSLTVDAAAALDLPKGSGTLVAGAPADIVVWNCDDFREPFYNYGTSHVSLVIKAGVPVVRRSRAGEVQYLVL